MSYCNWMYGSLEEAQKAIREGIDVNERCIHNSNFIATPLILAAIGNNHKVITALADAGADLNAKMIWGRQREHHTTALMFAAALGRNEAVIALLDAGANARNALNHDIHFSAELMLLKVIAGAKDYDSVPNELSAEVQRRLKEASSGFCYVATCVYGSYDCPEVWTLRRFRDNTLDQSLPGRAFIYAYYAISPSIIKLFGNTRWFSKLCKPILNKLVAKLHEKGVESTPYSDKY